MNNGPPDQTNPVNGLNTDDPNAANAEQTELIDNLQDTSAQDPHSTSVRNQTTKRIGQLPEHFGRYRVLSTLGKGGMGAVYLAEDLQLDRRVAIKVPFVDRNDSSTVLDRFHREAKALAAIVHPNICPIHEVGQIDGVHFLAMTYVEGKTLSEYINPEKPLSIKRALLLAHKLASALHHSHAAGVIHRDLKPANIIINSLKEPVIMDFGLARREGKSDAVATQPGEMMGTPAYMPPEQFAGDVAAMGPGCDIYSLGVILYELLTGQRPFSGGVMEIMSKIALEDPQPPSTHRPEIDGPLNAICLRALAKRPEDRFASMEELTTVLADYVKASSKQRASAETSRKTSRGGTIQAGSAVDQQGVLDSIASKPDSQPLSTLPPTPSAQIGDSANAPSETGTAALVPVGEGYRLIKQLGEGQYGEVWLGMAPGGIEVAIKKLLFPVGHKATQTELQALELMKRLRHSFLVQVQAFWVMEDQLMIVMELADGSLEERHADCLRETGQGIPRAELFGYMREAAEAIDFLHREQVLHRDIKPGNILLVKGHVKVADFGIATSGVLGSDQLTTTSATLGTPLYMGPELWNKQAGPRSDQYSLAVTYVELRLNTELAFVEQNRLDLSMLPEEEQVVLGKALAPNPRDRYESCKQFSLALEEIVESEHREVEEQRQREQRGIEERERQKHQRQVDKRRRRRAQLIAGVFILGCLPLAWYVWKNWQKIPLGLTSAESLSLTAGTGPKAFAVSTVGEWGDSPLDLVFENLPEGVEVLNLRQVDGGAEVDLVADLQSVSAEVEVTLVATAGGNPEQRRPILLSVKEAKCELPPSWGADGWEISGDAMKIPVGDRCFYDRIYRVLPDGSRIELMLIRQTDAITTPTFYCMRDKVSNGLFDAFVHDDATVAQGGPAVSSPSFDADAFVREQRQRIRTDRPERIGAGSGAEANSEHPAFRVTVEEAHAFAIWFGGLLPSLEQWDKAAGRWDHEEGQEGPYEGPWGAPQAVAEQQIALARPMGVGKAKLDVGPFGCRDMAGNGREWTRDLDELERRTVPVENAGVDVYVIVRGRSHSSGKPPLLYSDLEDNTGSESYRYNDAAADVCFRCVVEMPAD